jgi:hypothetical protein
VLFAFAHVIRPMRNRDGKVDKSSTSERDASGIMPLTRWIAADDLIQNETESKASSWQIPET